MADFHRDIGRCIYCDSTGPQLTREHVMPKGLGGKQAPIGMHEAVVLRRASCAKCQATTREFEGICQSSNFGLFRYRKGLKQKDRIKPYIAIVIDPSGLDSRVNIDPERLHSFLPFPLTGDAGIYIGNFEAQKSFCADVVVVPTHSRKLPLNISSSHKLIHEVHLASFFRLLAKIAHGMTVFTYGVDSVFPTLCEVILGDKNNFYTWIGVAGHKKNIETNKNSFHTVKVCEETIGDAIFSVVYIRLFSSYKRTPTYYVVSGIFPLSAADHQGPISSNDKIKSR